MKKDTLTFIVLLLSSPLWIAAGILNGFWYLMFALLSRLALPAFLNAPIVIIIMIILTPFHAIFTVPYYNMRYLWRKYITGDWLEVRPEGILLWRNHQCQVIPWQALSSIKRRFTPPIMSYTLVLQDQNEIALSPFDSTGELQTKAVEIGIAIDTSLR